MYKIHTNNNTNTLALPNNDHGDKNDLQNYWYCKKICKVSIQIVFLLSH